MATRSTSSGQKAHIQGTEALEAVGFDPLEELVAELEEITRLLEFEKSADNPRSSYIEKLHTIKLRILETLLPYKYGKAPISTVKDIDYREPIRIILTEDDGENAPQ